MVDFVGRYNAVKGCMLSDKCWLPSIYSTPVVFRVFITPSHSWMRRRWEKSILQEEVQHNGPMKNMTENNLGKKMYF